MPTAAQPSDNGMSMRGAPMPAVGMQGGMMSMPEGRRGDNRSQMMVMPDAPRVGSSGGKPAVSTTPMVGGAKPTFSTTPVGGGMSPAVARPGVAQPTFDAPASPQSRVGDRPTFTPTISSQAQPMPVGRPNVPTAARPAVVQTPTYAPQQTATYARPAARETADSLQFSRVDSANDRRGYSVSDSRSAAYNADRRPFQNHKPEVVVVEREPRHHSSTSVSIGFSYNSFNYYPASSFATSVYYSNACAPVTYSTVYYGPAYYSCAPVYYAPACFTPVYYAPTCYTPVYYAPVCAPVVYRPAVYYTPAVVVQPAPLPVYTPAPCGSSFFSFGISFGGRF